MLTKRGASDDEEAILRESRDGEITFNAAAFIERLSVSNRADGLIHFVGANCVEEVQRARAAYFKFVERSLVEESRVFARHQMFVTNRATPIVTRPAFGFVTMRRQFFIRLEPVRAFPAHFFAEDAAKIAQAEICGRGANIAPRHSLFAGIMNIIILSVRLKCARRDVIQIVVVWTKAAHIESPHIPFGMSVHDPFRHRLADSARARESMRAESARHPKSFDGCGSQQKFAVGRKAFGTIQEFDNFRMFNRRHALDGIFHQRSETFPIGREQLKFEILRDALHAKGRGLTLVSACDESADFFAPINQKVRVAQIWEFICHAFDGFGHNVKMRHRNHRQTQPDHFSNLASPHARSVNDHFSFDRAFIRHNFVDFSILQMDGCDRCVGENFRAAILRADCQRVGESRRVNAAVVGSVRRA